MPRRLIGINAIHNRFESLFVERVAAAHTPFATRLRHGFAFPAVPANPFDWVGQHDEEQAAEIVEEAEVPADPSDWVGRLRPGVAGQIIDGVVRSRPIETGIVACSPKLRLGPGKYEIDIGIAAKPHAASRITVPLTVKHRLQGQYHRLSPQAQAVARWLVSIAPGLRASLAVRQALRVTFEVALGSRVLAALRLDEETFATGSYRLPFEIAPSAFVVDPLSLIDLRVLSAGLADFALTRVVLRPLSPSAPRVDHGSAAPDAAAAKAA